MSDFDNILKAAMAKRPAEGLNLEVTTASIPLDEIKDRAGEDSRPIHQEHVEELADSISFLGLIQPLVVDSQSRLLAGSHRRAAIAHLRETDPDAFAKWFEEGVPVHRLPFDSQLQLDLALQVEIAENEHRKDYTAAEVRAIADRFRDAGYGVRGRPRKDQSPLIPALMAVVGKSRATVKRYLHGRSSSAEPDYEKTLEQTRRSLLKLISASGDDPSEQKLAIAAQKLVKQIDKVLSAMFDQD